MTQPAPDTIEREKDKLFVTDAEMIRRLGVPEKDARVALTMLEKDRRNGFPPKQAIWGGRRYWPAVQAWLDKAYGVYPQRERESA